MNFKKIASVAASVLMAGMSMGFASAAAFPAPFVQNGVANAAIVYGSNAAPTDFSAASNIQTSLAKSVTPTGTTKISGEHIDLNRRSTLLHVGEGVKDVFGRAITSTDMPNLLKSNVFRDSSNDDHDYTQKIEVANLSLNQFDLSDYDSSVKDTTPTIGVPINSDKEVLNYTLTFQDNVNMSRMHDEDLTIMGKDYYVLSASGTSNSNAKMTLLDSGTSSTLQNGGSTTLKVGNNTYSVKVSYIDSNQVKLTVNGETTNSLKVGEVYKLSDGSYLGIKDVYSNGAPAGSYAAGVDFSIGSGKIELSGGNEVQVNGDSINGLESNFDFSNQKLNKLILSWKASDDVAVASTGLEMPVFNGVSLAFGGMNYSANEATQVKPDGDNAIALKTVIKNGPVTVDILANNRAQNNFTIIGADSTHLFETSKNGTLVYDGSKSGNRFIASYNGGTYAESYLLTVSNFVYDSDGTTPLATISSKDGGSLNQEVRAGDDVTLGDIVLHVDNINKTQKTITLTDSDAKFSFNKLYTVEGLQVILPTDAYNTTAGGIKWNDNGTDVYFTSYPIQFKEADKDGNIANGAQFNITVSANSNDYKTTVSGVDGLGNGIEEGSSDIYDYVASSDLATSVKWDKSSTTQEDATITYHGGEAYGTLALASASATVSNGASSLGNIIYKDSEVANITADNVIVVGGSCINSAAAKVLGVPSHTCGEAFTKATGVGAGQYLIEGFANSALNGKYALVVAGYGAADTTNAATYLTNKNPDLSKKWTGTSATEAVTVTQ